MAIESPIPFITPFTPLAREAVVAPPPLYIVGREQLLDTSPDFLIRPQVLREIHELQASGIDAQVVDVAPRFQLEPAKQAEVDEQVQLLSTLPNTAHVLFDPTVHSAGAVWRRLSKRAIALQTLTTAGEPIPHAIAPGIDPEIYQAPMFDGRSAVEVVSEKRSPETAARIHESYREITTKLLQDDAYNTNAADSRYMDFINTHGREFLTSRDFLMGVVDAKAVQTRADAAIRLAFDHVIANREMYGDEPIVTASLACGAAGPVFELDKYFEANGVTVGKNILVDDDPMALASAVSLADSYGLSDKIEIQPQNLIKARLTDFIKPHSVHVVDILGIVDYLATTKRVGGINYKIAANFLSSIGEIMHPNGIIVAGNALAKDQRPQQEFFEAVWPPLEQRGPIDMLKVIQSAGYDPSNVKVRVPGRESVYGIYGIDMAGETRRHKLSAGQRMAQKLVQFTY